MNKQISMPSLPNVQDPALQSYLDGLHKVVANILTAAAPPNLPRNLTVTPGPGTVIVQFTRSNAVSYNLYAADSSDRSTARQINLGTANQYTDNVGRAGAARWYWIEGLNQTGVTSGVTASASATTLALTAPAAVLPVVPQSYAQVYDTTLGRNRPVISTIDTTVAGQPESNAITTTGV